MNSQFHSAYSAHIRYGRNSCENSKIQHATIRVEGAIACFRMPSQFVPPRSGVEWMVNMKKILVLEDDPYSLLLMLKY